jgi:putative transposase
VIGENGLLKELTKALLERAMSAELTNHLGYEKNDPILSMYARGMTTREIQGHLQEMYGVEVSPTLISEVTDGVMEEVKAWQNRPLESVYGVVYLDALYVKMRHEGGGKPGGVRSHRHWAGRTEGRLGLWTSNNEGAKFWLAVLTEFKNVGSRRS